MELSNKLKIFNDPIYGFIRIPNSLIFDLIAQPEFQRLRRISQMGLSYLVYPGAHHTRFHHALGSMHLMQQAIQVLRFKEVDISPEEESALLAAILLHDIGHGPFSHAMENSLVGVDHEKLSLAFMRMLNERMGGALELAIEIFTGKYKRKFMHQLISSQLDMDRLDYLKRDSFYTGVAEGNINAERLITMMHVHDDSLVLEEKGLYSVEKFLMARRFMYWQVYLHKTGVVAEQLLIRILSRAKQLRQMERPLEASRALLFFLDNDISADNFTEVHLETFARLDDVDILSAIKHWCRNEDFVLSTLCRMVLERRLLKITLRNKPVSENLYRKYKKRWMEMHDLDPEEAGYFVFRGTIENIAYNEEREIIYMLNKKGELEEVASVSDHFNLKVLSKPVVKNYLCYPQSVQGS